MSPPGSEFYRRRRRLAWIFAILCAGLSALQSSLGLKQEVFERPRVAPTADGTAVVCRMKTAEEESAVYTRLLLLDTSFQVRRTITLPGDASAVLVDGEDTISFFDSSVSLLRKGETVRRWNLGQPWPVGDAVLDPDSGELWLVGWHDGKILARQRVEESYSEPVPVAALKEKPVDLLATASGGTGPVVAWRETESSPVRLASFRDGSFVARGEFELSPAEQWDVVALKDRVILLSYRPEDRTSRQVTLRLRCCRGCGTPPPPERISFEDAPVLLGRTVLGVSGAVSGNRFVVAIARETALQVAGVSAATLLPEPGTPLLAVGTDPLGRRIAAYLLKWITLSSASALLFLGISMFREQRRLRTAPAAPRPALQIADIPQRMMAFILDFLIVIPIIWQVMVEVSSSLVERMVPGDARSFAFVGMCQGVNILYHVVTEAATGASLGKWILGLRVLQADGRRLGIGGAILRNLLRPIEGEGFVLLGALVMANSLRRQRLGDLLARTIVVQDPPTAAAPAHPAA